MNEGLNFRATPAEVRTIRRAAKLRGITLSEYLRRAALKEAGHVPESVPRERLTMMAEELKDFMARMRVLQNEIDRIIDGGQVERVEEEDRDSQGDTRGTTSGSAGD